MLVWKPMNCHCRGGKDILLLPERRKEERNGIPHPVAFRFLRTTIMFIGLSEQLRNLKSE